jgi:hypothetical protein
MRWGIGIALAMKVVPFPDFGIDEIILALIGALLPTVYRQTFWEIVAETRRDKVELEATRDHLEYRRFGGQAHNDPFRTCSGLNASPNRLCVCAAPTSAICLSPLGRQVRTKLVGCRGRRSQRPSRWQG